MGRNVRFPELRGPRGVPALPGIFLLREFLTKMRSQTMSNGERVLLNPGEILNAISGLKREKLMYWVLKGYIRTHRETRGKRDYVYFYKEDLPKLNQAYRMIVVGGMKDKEAFAKFNSGQLSF